MNWSQHCARAEALWRQLLREPIIGKVSAETCGMREPDARFFTTLGKTVGTDKD